MGSCLNRGIYEKLKIYKTNKWKIPVYARMTLFNNDDGSGGFFQLHS